MKIKDKAIGEVVKPSDPKNSNNDAISGPPPIDFTKEWNDGHKFFNSSEQRAFTELLHTEERFKEKFKRDQFDYRKPRNPLTGEYTPRDGTNRPILNPAKLNTVQGSNFLFNRELSSTYNQMTQKLTSKNSSRSSSNYADKIGIDERRYDVLGNTYNLEGRPQSCHFTRPETYNRPSTSTSSNFNSSSSFRPSTSSGYNQSSTKNFNNTNNDIHDPYRITFIDTLKASQSLIQENNRKKQQEQQLMREFIEKERAKRQSEAVKREMIYLQNKLFNKQKELEYLETIKNNK